MRGYQDSLQLHLQLRSARDVPSTPRPASGGRGRGAQGQLDAHVEGGQCELRRAQEVPAGADLRAAHHRHSRQARGAHRLLREVRPLEEVIAAMET
eukprot:scaffold51353_cov51-Phaeocystis_antarctica.AAC.1